MMRDEVAGMISVIPLKTERLEQAEKYFQADKDDMARAASDIARITQEQEKLLKSSTELFKQVNKNAKSNLPTGFDLDAVMV